MRPLQVIFILLFTISSTVLCAQVRPYAPEIFSDKISGAVCGFSKDAKIIYFVREDTTKKKLFLYHANWNGSRWVNATLLPFSGQHNDYGGRLTANGNTFYFASDRPGANDDKNDLWNIWKVERSGNGWKDPEPLHNISNNGDECCPVPFMDDIILFSATRGKSEWQILKSDSDATLPVDLNSASAWQWPSYFDPVTKTLLFNSMKRSDSKGMDDIYIAHLDNGEWKDVRNAGGVVNTAAYEDGAILSPDRKLVIFCRHDTGATPSRVLCVDAESIGIR